MQSKPKLKLGFTDYYPTLDEFFVDTLAMLFDIERDDENPDYLIFCDETFGTNNLKYDPQKTVKILFTGENRRPWNYKAHHAVSFDHLDGSQFYRLPLYVLDDWVMHHKHGITDMHRMNALRGKNRITYAEKEHFCGFVASNGGSEVRNNMFHMLNEYKDVKSGGPLFNNIGYVLPRENQQTKLDFFSKCRFSLCYENSSYPGYCTEKILHGFMAGTIPIYWGSQTVELDFNHEAFISRHNYSNDRDMIDHIAYLENNPSEWELMANKPFLNSNNKCADRTNFVRWFALNVYRGSK